MKRHPAFQDLSRDHYVVLNRVLQLLRSTEGHPHAKPLEDTLSAFANLWTQDGLPEHFDEEETDLLPVLRARNPGLAKRLMDEHAAIRAAFEAMWNGEADPTGPTDQADRADQADPKKAARLAVDLRAHVRWEEETLFEWLQANLEEGELQVLLGRSQAFRRENRNPAACAA